MNGRIRELAHEAGLPTYNPEGIPTKLGKFAELIVKECSGILRTEANSNWEGREERLLNAMANWIENHFGVEQ